MRAKAVSIPGWRPLGPISSRPSESSPISTRRSRARPTESRPIASAPTAIAPSAMAPNASAPRAVVPVAFAPVAVAPRADFIGARLIIRATFHRSHQVSTMPLLTSKLNTPISRQELLDAPATAFRRRARVSLPAVLGGEARVNAGMGAPELGSRRYCERVIAAASRSRARAGYECRGGPQSRSRRLSRDRRRLDPASPP